MSLKPPQSQDTFTFSLGGLRTIAGYTPAAVVADTCCRPAGPGRDGRNGRGSGMQRPAAAAYERQAGANGCCSAA